MPTPASSNPLLALSPRRLAALRRRLIAWFDRNQRPLPWRTTRPGRGRPIRNPKSEVRNPYRVWLSEIMLQQTQVVTALPYFQRFVRRFPTVQSLASADLQDVLGSWAGLGYYSRARNLHRSARMIVEGFAGRFPQTVDELMCLPGVGRYTAGAIRSIAFNRPAPIVDGNVARVLCRLFALAARGDPKASANQRRLWQLADRLVDPRHPSRFNQGLMELGALVCTPTGPRCPSCPLARWCHAKAAGQPEAFPSPRRRGPVRAERWAVAVIRQGSLAESTALGSGDSALPILMVRRPATGRWAGLWEFPGLIAADGVPPGTGPRKKGAKDSSGIRPLPVIRERVGVRVEPGDDAACSTLTPALSLKGRGGTPVPYSWDAALGHPPRPVEALRRFLRQRLGLSGLRLRPVGQVRHLLSHRDMVVEVFTADLPADRRGRGPAVDSRWVAPSDLAARAALAALPVSRLTRKIVGLLMR